MHFNDVRNRLCIKAHETELVADVAVVLCREVMLQVTKNNVHIRQKPNNNKNKAYIQSVYIRIVVKYKPRKLCTSLLKCLSYLPSVYRSIKMPLVY